METGDGITLEYHPANSSRTAYWLGMVGGREMRFVRVLVGVAVPELAEQQAAIVALGELERSFAPSDFTGLGAAVGTWADIKQALLQFCRDLKPADIVVGSKDDQRQIWPITDQLVGAKPLPLSTVAPAHSLKEVGKANVQQLLDEDRLHIEHLLPILNRERDQSDKALRLAVNFAVEFGAFYGGPKRKPLEPRLLGTKGL